MPNNRDPRTNPREGDVVEFGPQWQRETYSVTGREGDAVLYRMCGVPLSCTLKNWQGWTRGGDVITVLEASA